LVELLIAAAHLQLPMPMQWFEQRRKLSTARTCGRCRRRTRSGRGVGGGTRDVEFCSCRSSSRSSGGGGGGSGSSGGSIDTRHLGVVPQLAHSFGTALQRNRTRQRYHRCFPGHGVSDGRRRWQRRAATTITITITTTTTATIATTAISAKSSWHRRGASTSTRHGIAAAATRAVRRNGGDKLRWRAWR